MEAFTSIVGTAVPFMHSNVDTDQITPEPEILRARADGYRSSLFARWHYLDIDARIGGTARIAVDRAGDRQRRPWAYAPQRCS